MLHICKFQILKCASLLFGLEVHMVFLCQKMGVQKLQISFGILELVTTIWRISIQKRSGRRSGIWLDIKSAMEQKFCIKTTKIATTYDLPWPKGKYCIFKKGDCPEGSWNLCELSKQYEKDKCMPQIPLKLITQSRRFTVLLPFSTRGLICFGLVLSSFSCSTGETPEFLAELQAQAESDT